MAIYMWREYIPQELCFTANTAGSTVGLVVGYGSPSSVSLETSSDGTTWSAYTIGSTITLSNIGDKVYWRNTSETTTAFSSLNNYYNFVMTGSISASGDINYLINKNSTETLATNYCYCYLFKDCTSLTTAPKLPATTLTQYCYYDMFYNCSGITELPYFPKTTLETGCYSFMFEGCTSLSQLPELTETTMKSSCYSFMFYDCTSIKLSTTQTGEYQTPYRLPASGTGTTASNWGQYMFNGTGGTFTSDPTINTTYYTSNTVV